MFTIIASSASTKYGRIWKAIDFVCEYSIEVNTFGGSALRSISSLLPPPPP